MVGEWQLRLSIAISRWLSTIRMELKLVMLIFFI